VRARVGVAIAPEHAEDAVELIKRAEIALHSVKSDGAIRHRIFESGMDDHVQQQRALELDIRAALKDGEFEAHFQPQYDIKQKRISGFETLVRWRHATRGWVSPSDFVPVAEQLGLVGHLGEQMLHQACNAAVTWPGHMTVAVNVSTSQLKKRGFTSVVAQALSGSGLPADRLELEITESVLVDDDEMIINQLHQLRGLGVRLSLDDFGTGYASLGYLNRLPVTKIKIDQSFVKKLPDATDSIAIIGAITQLAQQLGMSTTAEGVETDAQLEAVTALGCTHVQGYLIGRATANPLTQTYQAA
jgi:predicted signal transduction protein with EAL and GGDEF domain